MAGRERERERRGANMSLPMMRSFSSEGGATKRDWKMRLSLRSRSGHSIEALRGRRCASLRGAPREESGRSTPAAAPRDGRGANMSLPMMRSFSSEGGATKRDWKMRLSLRSRSGHSIEALRGRRCASLRGAPREESGRSTPAAAPRAAPSPGTPAPKKSNWEVIEHFSPKNKKSPTAVST
ncbi:uncharacterized protein [Choristoneura fumiferana]|uniref:uncharacterized protein n=1 Tax=Choristoneura fumiferana TaxID=7141 RepID=UPI003D15678D